MGYFLFSLDTCYLPPATYYQPMAAQKKYDHFDKKKFLLLIKLFVALITLISLINAGGFIYEQNNLKKPANFGFSYSPRTAERLGLDPKQTYINALSDLNPKTVRLMAYWDEIEAIEDVYDFSDLDYYLEESEKDSTPVILSVGFKLPRWPECYTPEYLQNQPLSKLRQRQLKMVKKVIERYETNQNIKAFQIENEPLFAFGDCPPIDKDFFEQEVTLVKTLTKKPIIITDSGELNIWANPMRLSNIFGTTLYRSVSNPYFGRFSWPLPAWTYSLKAYLIKTAFAPENEGIIIAELQAETWFNKPLSEIPISQQLKTFTPDNLKSNALFARKTGFSESLFWGVEWWYYMKQHGHPEYVETARELFSSR